MGGAAAAAAAEEAEEGRGGGGGGSGGGDGVLQQAERVPFSAMILQQTHQQCSIAALQHVVPPSGKPTRQLGCRLFVVVLPPLPLAGQAGRMNMRCEMRRRWPGRCRKKYLTAAVDARRRARPLTPRRITYLTLTSFRSSSRAPERPALRLV